MKDILPGSGSSIPTDPVAHKGILYFNPACFESALWRSDGTAEGTYEVATFPGSWRGHGDPGKVLPFGDELAVFVFEGNRSYSLWMSDGTRAGTRHVKGGFIQPDTPSFPFIEDDESSYAIQIFGPAAVVGRNLYFSADGGDGAGRELWRSDGTAAGTRRISDLAEGSTPSHPSKFSAVPGGLAFVTHTPGRSPTLHHVDDATGQIVELRSFRQIGTGYAHGATVYFGAQTARGAGQELWRTDGTPAGTRQVAVRHSWRNRVGWIEWLGVAGPHLYFQSGGSDALRTNSPGLRTIDRRGRVRRVSDSDAIDSFFGVSVGKRLLFSQDLGHGIHELWTSAGTPKTTRRIARVRGSAGHHRGFGWATSHGRRRAYFTFVERGEKVTLWRTDGTRRGTGRVRAAGPKIDGNLEDLTSLEDALVFTAPVGEFGQELLIHRTREP